MLLIQLGDHFLVPLRANLQDIRSLQRLCDGAHEFRTMRTEAELNRLHLCSANTP